MEVKALPRRHRRRWPLFVLATLPVLLIGGYFAWDWLREEPHPVTLRQAAARFHERHGRPASAGDAFTPAEGVYDYRGRGSDRISFPPLEQRHGPRIPGTVIQGDDGCWTLRVDYSSNHWGNWTFCPRDGGLTQRSEQSYQRWDLGVTSVANRSRFTCTAPTLVPDMQPGDRWRQRCVGENDSIEGTTISQGPLRYVGKEVLRVGDAQVEAYHLVQTRDVSGPQRGSLHADLWVAPDGLLLRLRQSIAVSSPSPIGDIDYEETTDFTLQSLRPRR